MRCYAICLSYFSLESISTINNNNLQNHDRLILIIITINCYCLTPISCQQPTISTLPQPNKSPTVTSKLLSPLPSSTFDLIQPQIRSWQSSTFVTRYNNWYFDTASWWIRRGETDYRVSWGQSLHFNLGAKWLASADIQDEILLWWYIFSSDLRNSVSLSKVAPDLFS